jgi:hypothetical protein
MRQPKKAPRESPEEPFRRFTELAKRIVSVPKAEISKSTLGRKVRKSRKAT